MTRRMTAFFISFLLIMSMAAVFQAPAETLDEYKERMKKEQEEAEKKKNEQEQNNNEEKKSDDTCNIFSSCCQLGAESGCFESIFQAFLAVFSDVRYADYPYAPNHRFDFAAFIGTGAEGAPISEVDITDKFWMGELSVDASYLFGQESPMFDVQGILNAEILVFHVNIFVQQIVDFQNTTLATFSANAGFSVPLNNFIVSFYAGMFLQEGFPVYFSFGASMKVFLPGRIICSVYSLFSIYNQFFFVIVSPTMEVAFDRFTVGVGFNYYNYNYLTLYGPTVKTAIWF